MKKWFIRTLAGLILIAAVAAAGAWALLRASLPELDGELVVAGLEDSATIERDEQGIATITASNRRDLAFATGYAHAQDRFFQMDLIRRQAVGELSELFGAAAINADKRYRFHRFRDRARTILARQSARDVALIEAYTDGVNEGLNGLAAKPFEYFLTGTAPQPWQVEDTIVVVFSMYMQLNDDRARRDVRRGYAHSVLPPDVYAWMYPLGTQWDAPITGDAEVTGNYPGPDIFSIRELEKSGDPVPAGEAGRPPLNGSNNWAVSGALTANGGALVSNDMHLGHSVPNIWYQARLVATGDDSRDITGVTLPGAPFVVAGSNGTIAWGYTNSYGDWSDAVIVEPGASEGSYRTQDGDEAFAVYSEQIRVKDAEPVNYEIRETRWGPVDPDVSFNGKEIAVSWIAHHPEAVNLNIMGLETAESLGDALDQANTFGMPPQNFVGGDANGNIGWTIAGRIPVKGDFDPMVPADWSVADGWTGWRDPDEYPRVVNPESGRIWTANARVVDGEALKIIGDGGYDLAARAQQIRDGLFASDRFTPEDMLNIQRDSRAVFLSPWRDLLLETLDDELIDGDRNLIEYRQLVDNWIPAAAPDSVGYRLVRAFRWEVRKRVFDGLATPIREALGDDVNPLISNQFEGPLWLLVNERPMHLLPADYASWDALMIAALRSIIAVYDENYDGELADRSWGEYNTARISHPVSQAVPMLSRWLDMPSAPLYGDANLPLAQGPAFGASERFSVIPGDEQNGLMQMPTGQSGHPLSAFYQSGHEDWVNGTPSPFLPGERRHELTLRPHGLDASP
ncbi:MAG: penicillin acylase family protein [Pseudomonadota bacterium]